MRFFDEYDLTANFTTIGIVAVLGKNVTSFPTTVRNSLEDANRQGIVGGLLFLRGHNHI
jgi:hypothetical protein